MYKNSTYSLDEAVYDLFDSLSQNIAYSVNHDFTSDIEANVNKAISVIFDEIGSIAPVEILKRMNEILNLLPSNFDTPGSTQIALSTKLDKPNNKFLETTPSVATCILFQIKSVYECDPNFWMGLKLSYDICSKHVRESIKMNKDTVFIVHGTDRNNIRQEVARFLEKLELKVTILNEQTLLGDNILSSLESNSLLTDFVVVILTADELGGFSEETLEKRARPNVIFELGLFMGVLSKGRVISLRVDDIDLPSDYDGIIYLDYSRTDWKTALVKQMKKVGINFNLDNFLRF